MEGENDQILHTILNEAAAAGAVLGLENLNLALSDTRYGAYLLHNALEQGLRIVGVASEAAVEALQSSVLKRHVLSIELAELAREETVVATTEAVQRLAYQYQIAVDDTCANVCISASQDLEGCYPGKALLVLEMAVCRNARLHKNDVVGPDDIVHAARLLQRSMLA